jgi:hypothetical protein
MPSTARGTTMQLNAIFPTRDIGNDLAKIGD